jgi:transposase
MAYLYITKVKRKTKIYVHAKIVEGYRTEDGKVRHRTIFTIGPIKSDEDLKKAREIEKKFKEKEKLFRIPFTLDEIDYDTTLDFGLLWGIKFIFEKKINGALNLLKTKSKIKNIELIFKTIILNRLVHPSSDLSYSEWLKEIFDLKIPEQKVYRFLTFLYSEKTELENKIFEILKEGKIIEAKVIFYDLTSTFFHSSINKMVKYGYSRDKRADKKQIIIGIILIDDLPIATYVFSGNTQDKKTLEKILNQIKKRFKINKCILICDRGIISAENIEEIENFKFDYIIATKRRKIPAFLKELFEKENYTEIQRDGKRYVLIINKERREQELNEIEKLKKSIDKALNSLDEKQLIYKFGKACRFIDFKNKKIDMATYEYEKLIAGKYILLTNTSFTPQELERRYKELHEVEVVFRELKSVVKVRPIWHRKTENIVAHVFINSLALLVKRLLEKIDIEEFKELQKVKGAILSLRGRKYLFFNPQKIKKKYLENIECPSQKCLPVEEVLN